MLDSCSMLILFAIVINVIVFKVINFFDMLKNIANKIILLTCCQFLFVSCSTTSELMKAQERHQPVAPYTLSEGPYINIHTPDSYGWKLIGRGKKGMFFAKDGSSPDESFIAGITHYEMESTKNQEEFLRMTLKLFEVENESSLFELLESFSRYTNERGYPCVFMDYVYIDKKAKVHNKETKKLTLQIINQTCRHPVESDTGFAIMYSHRGHSLYENIEQEAISFINGVQVPD